MITKIMLFIKTDDNKKNVIIKTEYSALHYCHKLWL